jgi:hypothetical protein
LSLSDELAQHKCITPETRKRFEEPAEPQGIQCIAQRLAAICNSPNLSPQEHQRQYIKEWRSAICDFDFSTGTFTSTDMYSQMRPYLPSDITRKLEHPEMVMFGNPTRGKNPRRRILLDEVAKIEKKWGLV